MTKQNRNYQTEEQKEMIKFFIVLGIVVILILSVFFFSKIFMKPQVDELTYQNGSVSTTVAIVGTMLSQKEEEYYVLAYDYNSKLASAYETYASTYKANKKDAIKIYNLDLSSAFNKKYHVEENSNPSAKEIKDLKIKDGTLIKIQKGKIVEYVEGLDKIASKLSV